MELTRKQEEGLKIAIDRYNLGEKYTVISGYAGVGKSTLVRFIIEALDVDEADVCYATFTGKAAEVLRKKGNKNALTLHKLLYTHIPLKTGGFLRRPKTKDEFEYKIVVVDEISMVPLEMVNLLFTHDCYVICLGDPFQLMPIKKDDDNHLLDNPHIFLDEIMRQAAESEIIRLTMDIREEKPIELYQGNEVQIYNKNDLISGMLSWADQVIVATNKTRNDFNNFIRASLGMGPEPQDGDKIICLKNYWDIASEYEGDALVNGTIGYLQLSRDEKITIPRYIKGLTKNNFTAMRANIKLSEDDYFHNLLCDKNMIITGNEIINWKDKYILNRYKKNIGNVIPIEMAYGYAITCHKSQGSEWEKVLVQEEGFPFDHTEHARWLYTGCTRASDKLVLIKED